jgi:hypothetical protein
MGAAGAVVRGIASTGGSIEEQDMKRIPFALLPASFLLAACTNVGFASLTTPAAPGAEPVARAALTRPLTAAERKNSVVIVHHDATQRFETQYRVLNPTTEAAIEASALAACRKIDPRYFAAKLVRHDPPKGAPVGPKYYFSCI